MLSLARENLAMKLIAVVTAVVIWLFASADRVPREPSLRTLKADVAKTGTAPGALIVRLRQESVQVQVSGPKSQVDGLNEGDVKAEVDVSVIRPDSTQLRIRYVRPPSAPDVQVSGQPTVPIDVSPRVRKAMSVTAVFNDRPPAGTTFGSPAIAPGRADIVGAQGSVERVRKLVVFVETTDGVAVADLPIRALDKDDIEVTDVEIQPATAHVELSLKQAPATRTLLVNPVVRGALNAPFILVGASAVPQEVTVAGRVDRLASLTNVPTEDIVVDGAAADVVRDVRLLLPPGVSVKGRAPIVRVTVRVRDSSKSPG